jgi:hypothetical protein
MLCTAQNKLDWFSRQWVRDNVEEASVLGHCIRVELRRAGWLAYHVRSLLLFQMYDLLGIQRQGPAGVDGFPSSGVRE